tara:strand:- start:465 stop:800 length:336 start_codon:yes stop_codon:yes gene_type:complete
MWREKRNHCSWCGKPTHMEAMQLPETPILEFMEEKIDEHGRNKIWGEDGDWSSQNLDSDFEAELLVYDNMLSSISSKIVCITCLHDDDKLWEKYYGEEPDNDVEIRFDADF